MFSSINAVFHAAVPSDHPQAPDASLSALERLVRNDSFASLAGIECDNSAQKGMLSLWSSEVFGQIGGFDHRVPNKHLGAMTPGGWEEAMKEIRDGIH
jgi:hypothetical protein